MNMSRRVILALLLGAALLAGCDVSNAPPASPTAAPTPGGVPPQATLEPAAPYPVPSYPAPSDQAAPTAPAAP